MANGSQQIGIEEGMIPHEIRIRLYELLAASPLIFWSFLGIAGSSLRLSQLTLSWESTPTIGSHIATILFLGFVIIFLIIRRPPLRKTIGVTPRLVALIGCALPSFVALLPRVAVSPSTAFFSSVIALLGTTIAAIAVFFLGRSFSILPQARQLVTSGPYRIVRHPLYLAELAVIFGVIWEIQQPWPIFVLFSAIGIQVLRIYFEEKILSETFPLYQEYAKRTPRLLPGIY
jgi:protein-S-isoprenylcysteine O-methyltransferase Ste14